MKNILLRGFVWGLGFSLSVILCINVVDYAESYFFKGYSEIAHKINDFDVVHHSHRIIKSDSGASYLIIAGEVASKDFVNLSSIVISAELKNSEGFFVDSCDTRVGWLKSEPTVSFKIKCEDISSIEQFSSYEFSVQGFLGEFI